jgi:HEAT repeat protein
VRIHGRSGDRNYDRGVSALDARRWDDARQIFDEIAREKGPRADGALYWRAYAENRLGRRNEALATLASLRQQYPSSDWLNDAQALTVEIQQQAGKPVDPNAEANEELKLMAINVLVNQDPDRAVPLLEKILKSASSPALKDRALFVLTQSKSPQAQQLVLNIAKTGPNPDLQLRALNYLVIGGNKNAAPDIAAIYSSSHNQAIKKQALNSLMIAKAADELFSIARTEQDPGLRSEAIRYLGILHQNDKLSLLYQSGIAKDVVIENMFLVGDPAKVIEIARTEKDPKLRASAIQSLGLMRSEQAAEGLSGLYANEQDITVKKKIVEALWIQRNAKAMVDIAKKESNPEMKRDIVQKLTMMKSKEATDYLMELLK